ncbi:MAG: NTP transferase domain-containing protein, partial [Pseudomonadota bacterium]|nr:NTP transferase domain-containing protein [Pseudomonadota bacterium]
FKKLRVGLIQTTFPGFKNSLIEKAHQATQNRIDALGSDFSHEIICGHRKTEITAAILEMHRRKITTLLILGASAITDRRDIVPQAVLKAGGTLEHFGMPVDPGNLLLLAKLKAMHILGIPGSARSPRLHGFDWILQRLAAGISVGSKDITAMGVGGLLKEIPTRPIPRKHNENRMPTKRKNIAAIILAAGQSRRMGKENKMLIKIDGKPMVRHAVEAVMQAGINKICVVTVYQSKKLENALDGLKFKLVKNSQYSEGLSSSLKAGVNALPKSIEGALVMLGDMPRVNPTHLNLLIEAFNPDENKLICVPTSQGKRGNPVLWHKRFFSSISEVSGDVGARHLIGEYDDYVVDVEMNDNAVILDLDTPEAVQAYLKADK